MKLDEAIAKLNGLALGDNQIEMGDYVPALKLGTEALKRCKTLAENSPLWAAKPLPGETK